MLIARREAVAAATGGGLVLAVAFPPWSAPWLAPVGVAAFFLATHRSRIRDGAVAGLVFGLAFFGPTLWWLSESIAPAAWAGLVTVQSGWLAVLGAGVSFVRRVPGWPLWVSALWTSIESARSTVPWGGLPWGRLGYTAVDTPWAGSLAWVGVAGASALVALMGALLALLVEALLEGRPVLAQSRRALLSGIVAISLLALPVALALSGWSSGDAAGSDRTASIGVVQAEVPGDGTDVAAHHREITRTLLLETRRLGRSSKASATSPDLVVWPENATAVDPETDGTARAALLSAAEVSGAPVLAGSIVDGPSRSTAFNQSVVWTTSGPEARYTKQHLVPFGEYVPLRPLATRLSTRVSDIQRDMLPGGTAAPLPAGDLQVAAALCFDVAYDDVLRGQVAQGAELAVVQTSNAMFTGTAQQEQQWMITRARAIEIGRSVVVSSMNGISGAITPDGSVSERLPAVRPGSTVVTVPLSTRVTPAVNMGPWPARGVYAVGVVAGLVAGVRRSHRRRRASLRFHYAA